jgi:hypothetical protein
MGNTYRLRLEKSVLVDDGLAVRRMTRDYSAYWGKGHGGGRSRISAGCDSESRPDDPAVRYYLKLSVGSDDAKIFNEWLLRAAFHSVRGIQKEYK